MDHNEFSKLLNPRNDDIIDSLEESCLEEFLKLMINLSGIDKEIFLRHMVRNFRRRLLYSLIPAKVLRYKNTRRQFELDEDIIETLCVRLGMPKKDASKSPLKQLIRQLSVDLIEVRELRDYDLYKIKLAQKDVPRCRLCGYLFRMDDTKNISLKRLFSDEPYFPDKIDVLKPLSAVESLRSPEIDHLVPMAGFGTNGLDNLQLLCSLCNKGKADFLSYAETREASGFRLHKNIERTELEPTEDRILFYAVMSRDKKCYKCGRRSNDVELTLAPVNTSYFFLYDNLVTTCYDCDTYQQRWKTR